MSDIAIRVEGLGKKYRIGTRRHDTLRDGIVAFGSRLAGAARRLPASRLPIPDSQSGHIWALKDVSFEVKRGEVVGIIGRNGSGKSTLLKVLSRITEPTEGLAEIHGRIGSLLEVGTGFHPELTGRENIYLNGAILGMKKAEIARKFDEIVAFAEIEKFLDTPVKRYSSGMYVRLAFAVAAHLEPEILTVDEVLAVGDAAFQKKCLGKMGDVAKEGRTVLFVSHNMDAILRLCPSAIRLDAGTVLLQGPSACVVESHISDLNSISARSTVTVETDPTDKKLLVRRVSLDSSPLPTHQHNDLHCSIDYEVLVDSVDAVVAIRIDTVLGTPVITVTDVDVDETCLAKHRGSYHATCSIPTHLLAPGMYSVTVSAADMKGTRFDYREAVLIFDVLQSQDIKPTFRREGPLLVPTTWRVERTNS